MNDISQRSPAELIATLIHEGFDVFYNEFKRLTRECRQWFDARDWIRIHEESHRRIDLYQQHVSLTLSALAGIIEQHGQNEEVWKEAHNIYGRLVEERIDSEVAETFFNAITRKVFRTVGVNAEIEFLENDFHRRDGAELPGLYRRFRTTDDFVELLAGILRTPRPALAWNDLNAEAEYLAARLREALRAAYGDLHFDHIDILKVVFFRVREAYIVGRISRDGRHKPLLIPIQAVPGGVVVDGAIFSTEETLEVFSSTRAYFFVDVNKPADLCRFLGTLMPMLTLSELYIAIAHHRHGKTLIYRELIEHLRQYDDKFVVAPGIKGLVMTVFTMPTYRNVFKIIRDSFEKPAATRENILQSYRDVFRGRRVGRLADTQEFEHLAFERRRFTGECLDELLKKAPGTVKVVGDEVVVSHVYIEEKMTPLNIYMEQAPSEFAEKAIVDYGYAIKELAANNIFAGDLLWKNFGVTRFGRLVLYDYDEIRPLLDCNFKAVPKARSWEDEMSAQAWYPVAENDVFPEEWAPFIVPRRHPRLEQAFLSEHRDLFTPEFWQKKQRDIVSGELHIGLPYAPRHPELQRVAIHGRGVLSGVS